MSTDLYCSLSFSASANLFTFAKILKMKKIYTLTVFSLLLTNLIFAQTQMPNASFETWSSGEPTGWGTSDGILVNFGQPDPTTVEQDTAAANVYAGSSSVRLTNKHVVTPFGAQDIPGVVSLGTLGFDLATFSPSITGYAYTDRPDSVRFAAKYTSGPSGTDTGNVAVTLTRWTPGGRIVVGNTRVQIPDNASFLVFTQKITYHSIMAPDTLLVQAIATSSQTSVLESQMWVDDFSFNGLDTAFKAYINPGASIEICDGDTIRFRTDNTPPNTYQWYRNDIAISKEIPGLNSEILLNIVSMDSSDEGTYHAVIRNICDTLISQKITLNMKKMSSVQELSGFKIYPQPADNVIIIEGFDFEQGQVTLFDIFGASIRDIKFAEGKAILSSKDIPSGMYMLRFISQSIPIIIIH